MTILLSKSRFIHIPKTGGSWARRAIRNSGAMFVEPVGYLKHAYPSQIPGAQLFTFAFVRNPWDWLSSWWAYRMRTGWKAANEPLDIKCRSDDFQQFIDKTLEYFPGVCTYSYEQFLGKDFDQLDFIGRTENLRNDLETALKTAEEPVANFNAIALTTPVNCTDYSQFHAVYRLDQAELIGKYEQRICKHFHWKFETSEASQRT